MSAHGEVDNPANTIRSECTDVILGFAHHVDHHEFDKAVAEFHDQLIKTAAGWKIQHRRGVPVLMIKPQ